MTCEEMIYSNDYADALIGVVPGYAGSEDIFNTGCINYITEDIAILHVPKTEGILTNLESVPYSSVPKLYGLMESSNVEAVGVKKVQNPAGLNLKGRDVIVGIIDTGIDYENPLFRNGDGTTRIGVIWNQAEHVDEAPNVGQAGAFSINEAREEKEAMQKGKLPQPLYGRLYEQTVINQALSGTAQPGDIPPKDDNGHGTFLAGIAAGGVDDSNDFTGIATESELAVVSLKMAKPYLREYFGIPSDVPAYSETDIIYAVRFLLQYASYKNKPVSILIGVGSSFGGHNGLTFLERYLDNSLKKIGIMVSAAAGNEGNERLHYEGRLDEGTEQQVEINVAAGQKDLVVEFWGKRPATFAIGLISPQGDRIERIPPRFGKEELIRLPLSKTDIYVAYQLVEVYSGDELVFIRMNNPTPGLWRIVVYGDGEKESYFNIWMPLRQFLQKDTYFLQGTPNNTIVSPGNGEAVMTMTAYNHLNDSIYASASRGYTVNELIKPDLAAPGVNVDGPGLRNNYVRKSGTSVAAAHSAGMLALLLEWVKDSGNLSMVYSEQLQSICLRRAMRQPDVTYPNPVWGYGIMNIEQIFDGFRVTGG